MVGEAYRMHRSGNLAAAEALYRQALEVDPKHLTALGGLGSLLLQQGRGEPARKVWGRTATLYPGRAEVLANLGLAYQMEGMADEAERSFERALALKPEAPDLLCHLAQLKLEQGDSPGALDIFRRALDLAPDNPQTLRHLGAVHAQLKNWPLSAACLRRVAELQPEDWTALADLGIALRHAGRPDQAKGFLQRALELDKDNPYICNNLAAVCLDLRRWARAEGLFRQALTLMPDWIGARKNLGYSLLAQGKLAEATLEFLESLAQDESDPSGLCHLARALYLQGKLQAADEAFGQALQLEPDFPAALIGRATLNLLAGRENEAWPLIRRRYQGSTHPVADKLPLWDARMPEGTRVLVWADCGLAEALTMLPALAVLKAQGARPWLQAPEFWAGLLAGVEASEGLAPLGDDGRDFDCHAPLAALPALLELAPDGARSPILAAPPEAEVAEWRQRLGEREGRLLVGLAWACTDGTPWDAARTPGDECWKGLGELEGVEFVPLQPGPHSAGLALRAFTPPQKPEELAALMAALDLVVLPEGWPAALAGAAGIAAWVLLGPGPGWSWGLDDEASPWHPGLSLIRTTEVDDWTAAGEELASRLARFRASPHIS